VQIRDAISHDKEFVLEFCKNTFSWGDYIVDVWDSWISEGKLFVVAENSTIIGICHTAILDEQVWIEGIRIHPKYRKQGYGRKIIEFAESYGKSKFCRIARMIIDSENNQSLKLAEFMGYHIEDKFRLYNLVPKKKTSSVTVAFNINQIKSLISSNTYADSWRWFPLDESEIHNLIRQKRILISSKNGIPTAVGIWNESKNFANVLQIGLISGTLRGINDILRYVQNKGHEMGAERIQIFSQEKIELVMGTLEKRNLFYLMKKHFDEVREKNQ